MECLRGYIGIKHCGFAPSDSGEYINSYPGIEFAMIDKIANADQVDYAGVWADIEQRAIKKFRIDVLGNISGFNDRYRLRQITQNVDLGKDLTVGTTQAPSANKSGMVIELKGPSDQAICSNMQSLYVQSIQFYMVNYGNATITVRDADQGTVLDTYVITGVYPGWIPWKIDKQYDDVARISITVDTTAITTAYLDLSAFGLQNFGQGNQFSNTYGWNESGLWFNYGCTGTAQVRGVKFDANYANPVFGVNTFGLSAVFAVKCTYNNVVCKNKRHFLNAWGLCLCIELLTERIYSSRINNWTTVDLKKATQLRSEMEIEYRGGQKQDDTIKEEGELKRACSGIDLDLSDCCIEVDAPIIWRESQM